MHLPQASPAKRAASFNEVKSNLSCRKEVMGKVRDHTIEPRAKQRLRDLEKK
jgi:hypothetical protein